MGAARAADAEVDAQRGAAEQGTHTIPYHTITYHTMISHNLLYCDYNIIQAPVPGQQDLNVGHSSTIGFCGKDNKTPFIVFNVLLRDRDAVSRHGATPLPTHPDMPAPAGQPPQDT